MPLNDLFWNLFILLNTQNRCTYADLMPKALSTSQPLGGGEMVK